MVCAGLSPFLVVPSLYLRLSITIQCSTPYHNFMGHNDGHKWIERDSNGRYMFKRKRTKRPSTRSVLADAFGMSNNPFSKSRSRSRFRSQSLPRPQYQNYFKVQAPVRTPTPLALSAPPTTTRTTTSGQRATMPTTPEDGKAVVQNTGMYSQPPWLNGPNQQFNPYSQYPSYPTSFPGYYLAPNPVPGPPGGPPGPFAGPPPPLPPGARVISPPRPPTEDELKYKCSICGRFRSPRYHYRHPIPPGELPVQTVCRRCRHTGTDSEDSSDENERRRGRRRSKSVVSISEPVRVRDVSQGGGRFLRRRSSRVDIAPRSRSRHREQFRRRSVSSSSFDSDEAVIVNEGRRRKARSRSVGTIVERVRYIEEIPARRPTPPREIIYIEDDHDFERHPPPRFEDDSYTTEYDTEEDYVPRRSVDCLVQLTGGIANLLTSLRRVVSRRPSITRIARRKFPEPVGRERVRVTTRFDGPNSIDEEARYAGRRARPASPSLPDIRVLRVSEDEAQRIRRRLATSDEYEIVVDRPVSRACKRERDWYEDESSGSGRESQHRQRSRSRLAFREDLDDGKRRAKAKISDPEPRHRNSRTSDYMEPPRILPPLRAPSPPPADRRRSARPSTPYPAPDEDRHGRRTSAYEDYRGPRMVVDRRRGSRSRSRSRRGSSLNPPFGGRPPRSGSEAREWEMQDRIQEPPPVNEDYDWFDSHGQRVRVREI